jgi:hypothetical protein
MMASLSGTKRKATRPLAHLSKKKKVNSKPSLSHQTLANDIEKNDILTAVVSKLLISHLLVKDSNPKINFTKLENRTYLEDQKMAK